MGTNVEMVSPRNNWCPWCGAETAGEFCDFMCARLYWDDLKGQQVPAPGWATKAVFGLPMKLVLQAVSEAFDVSVEQLLAHDRHKQIALARKVAMFIARRVTGSSYPEIALQLGNRDHTTIMAGERSINRLMASDERLRSVVSLLLAQLEKPTQGSECTPAGVVAKCSTDEELRDVG